LPAPYPGGEAAPLRTFRLGGHGLPFAWICVLAAGALGLLGESGLLGDLLIGAGLGALLGKLVIGSLEREP